MSGTTKHLRFEDRVWLSQFIKHEFHKSCKWKCNIENPILYLILATYKYYD